MTGRRKDPEFARDFRGFGTADRATVPMGCPDLAPIYTLLDGSTVRVSVAVQGGPPRHGPAHVGQEGDAG